MAKKTNCTCSDYAEYSENLPLFGGGNHNTHSSAMSIVLMVMLIITYLL